MSTLPIKILAENPHRCQHRSPPLKTEAKRARPEGKLCLADISNSRSIQGIQPSLPGGQILGKSLDKFFPIPGVPKNHPSSIPRASPLHLYLQNPPNPRRKGPDPNPRSCAKIPLTHNSLSCIFDPPQNEFLSNTGDRPCLIQVT